LQRFEKASYGWEMPLSQRPNYVSKSEPTTITLTLKWLSAFGSMVCTEAIVMRTVYGGWWLCFAVQKQ
jgi:hypothetical protein